MNFFDYLFEHTSKLEKKFLEGKEILQFNTLYNAALAQAETIQNKVGVQKNILLISANNQFFIQTYLAIIKSGNICIPLDPSIEISNFNYIIQSTKPALIFLSKELSGKLPVEKFDCIYPEMIQYDQKPISGAILNSIDNENCAEIIFTSGSSGKPKGVMLSHKNLIANTTSILSYLHLKNDDRILVVLPFYYCYGLSLLHTHLRIGGSIVLNNAFIFLGKVIKDLNEYKCTGFAGVPSHFQILMRKSDSFKSKSFPFLKYVTQAGGGLSTTIIDEFNECFPSTDFYVMYGQTEATARLSYLDPAVYKDKKGSIGKSIPGVEIKIINETGEKVKPGQTGEIVARGDNIMLGYLTDDSENEQPIKNGWLYTGDLGTIDNDGYIFITARKKEIIKVNGMRISPREIKDVIMLLPEVVDCSVEKAENNLLGECIKATIVTSLEPDSAFNEQVIKNFCSNHLALYKVPQEIEFKKNLIINGTGKKTLF